MTTFTLQQKHAQLDAHNAKRLAQLARETPDNTPIRQPGTTISHLGDERQLRGIPALSRGVAGAITGTRPGASLR